MYKLSLDKLKLYNKYRPNAFSEVIGQDDAVSKLRSIIQTTSFSNHHNYIFHSALGGVGKTLLARIFAKAMNCHKPVGGDACGVCPNCRSFAENRYPDYHEFNAAEWNTVDKVNSIVDLAAHVPHNPTGVRVIVMDEFQRVSGAAQDNMLKVLEEATFLNVFILCTTEFPNIKDTIRSRCFDLEMKSVPVEAITAFLEHICSSEGFLYRAEDLESLAMFSKGCVREAVKKLEFCVDPRSGVVNSKMLTYKYGVIFEMLLKAIRSDLRGVRESLSSIEGISYKDDFLAVLLDFQLSGIERPRVLPASTVRQYAGYVRPFLPALRDVSLKYNFNTEFEFFLMLCAVSDLELVASAKVASKGTGRRFVNKNAVPEPEPGEVVSVDSFRFGSTMDFVAGPVPEAPSPAPVETGITKEDLSLRMKKLGFTEVAS